MLACLGSLISGCQSYWLPFEEVRSADASFLSSFYIGAYF
jgi:hypothetical protein